MKKLIYIMSGILLLMGVVYSADAIAQTVDPPLKVTLALDKSEYVPGDNIKVILTLKNDSGNDIITTQGFSDKEFYLYLRFFDEKGNIITSNKVESLTPPTPRVFTEGDQLVPGDLVETLEDGWVVSFGSFTVPAEYVLAENFYPLSGKSGHFTVKAVLPMRTYPSYEETASGVKYAPLGTADFTGVVESNVVVFAKIDDADDDGYFYPQAYGSHPEIDCDDNNPAVNPGATEILSNGKDDDCNSATPDVATVTPGTLNIRADKHTVGSGNHPGSTKEPMAVPVRIYDKSAGSCVSQFGVSWQNYKSIWLSCTPNGAGSTDASSGSVAVELSPGDYIVIAKVDDDTYLGVSAGGLGSGETMQKYLQLIVKADGKKVPAKYTKKEGSELLVIEPEYIEWDGTQQLYPFVFDSVGDWGVVTAVIPPVGFESDYDALEAQVTSEVEALQFTITDVGTKWKPMCVEHFLTHKKNKQTLYNIIGINLTKELAAEKELDAQAILENQREFIQENSQYCHELEQERKQGEQGGDQGGKGKGKKK